MKQRNFNLFTQAVILNASQMAYLEDAKKTQTMLLRFNELFRYYIKPDSPVILSEELNGLKTMLIYKLCATVIVSMLNSRKKRSVTTFLSIISK